MRKYLTVLFTTCLSLFPFNTDPVEEIYSVNPRPNYYGFQVHREIDKRRIDKERIEELIPRVSAAIDTLKTPE